MTHEATYLQAHGHHHGERDHVTDFESVDLGPLGVYQFGRCGICGEVIARRYVITGPGTGPWTILEGERI